jgi:plasmid stabilization system protein ParE
MNVVWTEQAFVGLAEIEAFIARDNPEVAARVVDKLVDRAGPRLTFVRPYSAAACSVCKRRP